MFSYAENCFCLRECKCICEIYTEKIHTIHTNSNARVDATRNAYAYTVIPPSPIVYIYNSFFVVYTNLGI